MQPFPTGKGEAAAPNTQAAAQAAAISAAVK